MKNQNSFKLNLYIVVLLTIIGSSNLSAQLTSLNNDKVSQTSLGLVELMPLLGTWKMEVGDVTTIETWKKLSNDTYEGSAVQITPKTGDTIARESLILAEMGNEVFYIAKVFANKFPIPFKYVGLKNATYTFENDSHDFPKSIAYKFDNKDKITITLTDGKKVQYFYYYRAKSE